MVLQASAEETYIPNDILLSVFDIASTSSVELNSDITDYYVEDNTPVQDHIALKPKTITISGYQGELVTRTEQEPIQPLTLRGIKSNQIVTGIMGTANFINKHNPMQYLNKKIEAFNVFTPLMSPQVNQARTKISRAFSAFDKYKNLISQDYNMVKDIYANASRVKAKSQWVNPPIRAYSESYQMDRQKEIYNKFEYLWANKILCFVDTPWGKFDNMAIQSISVTQDEETKHITDISITFKKINYAKIKFDKFDVINYSSQIQQQQHSEMEEMGKTQGKEPLESVAHKIKVGKITLGSVVGF